MQIARTQEAVHTKLFFFSYYLQNTAFPTREIMSINSAVQKFLGDFPLLSTLGI